MLSFRLYSSANTRSQENILIKAAVLFDLGGVYYSEGFREGLKAIARKFQIDEDNFFETATNIIFSNGYVTGKTSETVFWQTLSSETGITSDLYKHRDMVLEAFKPSMEMTALIREIREHLPVVLLTDQTNWLYDLDERDGLLNEFDEIVNSFEEGYSKRDPEIFRITCQRLGMIPEDLIFFDDNPDNVRRSNDFGIEAHVFNGPANSRDILMGAGVLESKDEKGDYPQTPQ